MFTINIKHIVRLRPIQFPVLSYAKFVKKIKSNEEREAELKKQRFDFVHTTITSALKNRKFMPVSEWKSILTELKKNAEFKSKSAINHVMFAVLLSLHPPNDSLQNAKNFIESSNLEYDLGVKRFIIQLYAKKAMREKLTETEEQELLEMCNELITKEFHLLPELHPVVVMGLCATKEWKKAFDLPKASSNSLNILARRALHANDIELVWKILPKLTQINAKYRHLATKTIVAFAKYFEKNPKNIPQNAETFLELCECMQIVFDELTLRELLNALHKSSYHAKITNIDYSGTCKVCNTNLEAVRISDNDFTTLQTEFIKNVVKGADIYQKTTPEEWLSFERVIREKGPFDIVMDGLNVAYNANIHNQRGDNEFNKSRIKKRADAFALKNVVSQLTREGKRVLVVGREHMKKWPAMESIERMATVFLVENISKDDIFLLYAAIHSGQNSYILSNDYMRQHKFAIGPKFNALFKKWQQDHWYGFTIGKDKPIDLVKPMPFKMHTHKIDQFWHLPYKTNAEIESKTWNQYEQPKNWACVRVDQKK